MPGINFGVKEAASIGIIGGADGPTAIYVTKTLAPALLPAIADCGIFIYGTDTGYSAAYYEAYDYVKKSSNDCYGTASDRLAKTEKILFPIIVTIVVALIVPDAVSLVGMSYAW